MDNANHPYTPYYAPNTTERLSDFGRKIVQDATDTYGAAQWYPFQTQDCLIDTASEPAVTLAKEVRDIQTGNKLGTILLSIGESHFSNIFRNLRSDTGNQYFITDSNGQVIVNGSHAAIAEDLDARAVQWLQTPYSNTDSYKLGEQIFIRRSLKRFNWTLVVSTPYRSLLGKVWKLLYLIPLFGLVFFISSLLATTVLAKVISYPIVTLKQQLLNMHIDDLSIEYPVTGTDEIGMLSTGLSQMLDRIRELMTEMTTTQQEKHRFELALLQSQIKPHFLYNTLESACALTEMGRTQEAEVLLKALAGFFRIVLSEGNEMVTLREELHCVELYLKIQQIRYADILTYQIKASPNIMDCALPKLTIQPLVENAIYHGLKPAQRKGCLKVEAYSEQGAVVINVCDDGVGFCPQETSLGFGLRSVNDRIRLYFNGDYGLSISSMPGHGCVAQVTFPQKDGEVRA